MSFYRNSSSHVQYAFNFKSVCAGLGGKWKRELQFYHDFKLQTNGLLNNEPPPNHRYDLCGPRDVDVEITHMSFTFSGVACQSSSPARPALVTEVQNVHNAVAEPLYVGM